MEVKMASELGNYLMKLSTDPQALKDFRADMEGQMQKAGLSQEEISIVKSKDPKRIKEALGELRQGESEQRVLILILII
jgi:hypothetical protein